MSDCDCQNCNKDQACVPFFLHENCMMHYNRVNKRFLIAFIAMCATLLIAISIFVYGNTVRERQLIELANQRRVVEVEDAKETTPPGI